MIPRSRGKPRTGIKRLMSREHFRLGQKPMDTLEQRVERLERSCRRWKLGCLLLIAAGLTGAAAQPAALPDGQFAHLSAQSIAIRSRGGGALITASCVNDKAAITLSSSTCPTVIRLMADKDSANVLVSQMTPKGLCSAAVSVDGTSGFIDLHDTSGKNKEYDLQ